MISGQLGRVGRFFAQFYAGTRKSLCDFWPPMLEQPIKFVLIIICSLREEPVKFSIELPRQRCWLTFTILLENISRLIIRILLIRTQILLL